MIALGKATFWDGGYILGKRCNEEILSKSQLTFAGLVDSIKAVDTQLAQQASKAVNISLTLRSWLIGMYIGEYEQNGKDRASYGDKLLENLSSKRGIK